MLSIRDNAIKLASNIRKFFKLCIARFDRESIAKIYIKGKGIEIGALHKPLRMPQSVKVKYMDRMLIHGLKKEYPELSLKELVTVDIVDDGQQLSKIKDSTQDFIIANQFLEHCQNPIGAIKNMLRVLKKNGVLYLSIPDKRYSFDLDRPITSIEHLLKDYQKGPDWSKREHFDDWLKYVKKIKDDTEVEQEILRFMRTNPPIHYHVWTQTELIELLVTLRKKLQFNFEVELFVKNMGEVIVILRKTADFSKDLQV